MRTRMNLVHARDLSSSKLKTIGSLTLGKDGIVHAPGGPLSGREPFVLDGQTAGLDMRVLVTHGNVLIGTCASVDESIPYQTVVERFNGAFSETRKSSKAQAYFFVARPGSVKFVQMIGNGVANIGGLCGLVSIDDMCLQSDGKKLYIGGNDTELGHPMIAEVNPETGRPMRRWTIISDKTAVLEWSAASPLGIVALVIKDGKFKTLFKSAKAEDFSPLNIGIGFGKVFATADGDFVAIDSGNGKVYNLNPATVTAREIVQIRSDEDVAGIAHERDRTPYAIVQKRDGSGWRSVAI